MSESMLVEFLSAWYILLMLLFLFAQNVTYCFIINQGHIFLCPPPQRLQLGKL